ncbi:MAG: cytochrome c family protein [Sphaerospermopsis sp. SIO1G2]|nr:cytochrome c family protein [Sphaerospermopsis sp. SIO1G2]
MNGFELNKVAAAVLLAGTVALSISLVVNGLYDPTHYGEEPKRGYEIEVSEVSNVAAPKEEAPELIAEYFTSASLEKGQKLTKACVACHSFDQGGPHKVGPNLWDIVGKPIAYHDNYSYSNALASHGGQWDYQSLSEFLKKPKKFAKGTKMAYAGMKKPQDRASLILYLRSLSAAPLALPEPPMAPVEEMPVEAVVDGDAAVELPIDAQ